MSALEKLGNHLRAGKVYRREDLAKWSASVDRHLKELVDAGTLKKLSAGLYYCPRKTPFGDAPPAEHELVAAFLKDHRFLVTSPNAFNALGLGTTQLYNDTVVYNHKRHGRFKLGGRVFDFRVKPAFPKSLTREFLLVDLVNNLDRLAEDQELLISRVKALVVGADKRSLSRVVRDYGSAKARKFFAGTLQEAPFHAS